MNMIQYALLTAGLILAGSCATSASALPQSRLTVVHQGGRTVTNLPASSRSGARAKSADVCDADDSVLFAFLEQPAASNRDINRSNGGGVVGLEVTMECSRISGQVLLEYTSSTPAAGASFQVTPNASVSLATTPGASAAASFSVQIINAHQTGDEQFGVRRSGGSFGGEMNGNALMGTVAAGVTDIFRVHIVGGGMPDNPPAGLGGLEEDPYAMDIYREVRKLCVSPAGRDRPECLAMAELANEAEGSGAALGELVQALRAVSPEKTTAMTTAGKQVSAAQMGNVALRVATLLQGGGGGFNTSGLTLVDGDVPLSLGMLGDVLNAAGEDENEEKRTLLGGTRWGVWVNGAIGGGEQRRIRGNAGFDFDNWSLTAGMDYRLRDTTFVGAAIGLSRLSSKFDGVRDSMDADGRALHLYAGYSAPSGLALDGSLSLLRTSYELVRYLPEPGSTDLGVLDYRTRGTPDSSQVSGSLGVSWYFQRDIWTFAPTLQYEFLRTHIDAFEEDGQSLFRLGFAEENLRTRSLSAGFSGDVTLATEVGTFRPYLRTLWYADSGTGAANILAYFVEGGQATPMHAVVMAEPDRSYGTVELGLGFRRPVGARTVDFNLGVLKAFGIEGMSRWGLRFDLRVPF